MFRTLVGVLVVSILLFIVLAGVLVVARRGKQLAFVFLGETGVLAASWLLARAAIASDYRDADGYIDCWPACTVLQDSITLAVSIGPLMWLALGIVAAVLAAIPSRGRGRVPH